MRFVLAIATFVVAALMIGLGIAQHTFLAGPDRITAATSSAGGAAYTIVDGETLNAHPGLQDTVVRGDGEVFAAYGPTVDVEAWVGSSPYTRIAMDEQGALTSQVVQPEATTPTPTPSPTADASGTTAEAEPTVTDPRGSDLWLSEQTGQGEVELSTRLPADVSLILATDGQAAAPADVALSWPSEGESPWVVPLVVGGIALLVLGLVLYLLALRHLRRSRGPRRNLPPRGGPRIPRIGPAARRAALTAGTGAAPAAPKGRGRRGMIALPVLVVTGLALSGCTAQGAPADIAAGAASTATPTPTSSLDAAREAEDADPPVVTEDQAARIVSRVSEVATAADQSLDAATLTPRFAGPALQERTSDYQVRKAKPDATPVPSIPTGDLQLTLPQATLAWPRTVAAVVKDPDTDDAPTLSLTLVQDSPRDNYRVLYVMPISTTAALPDVAPAAIGAARLAADVKLLALQPDQLSAAYADVLNKGDDSEYADLFDPTDDGVRAQDAKRKVDFPASIGETGSVEFAATADTATPVAMSTVESGALVSVTVQLGIVAKPTAEGAKVNANPEVQAITGLTDSAKGFDTVRTAQMLMYVPPVNSGEKIRLYASSTHITSAKELP
ncbi:hypothetical protein [Clavibacter phaseoli]|uniref:hypothetical protein n=1 Tax=Clavibacter phaseoli TaxID=1734031 RepID=UPI001F2FB927|nr:hypothetical protein [Clavibacter phaseoli]UKF30793.1 hypothetical protein FGD69_06895 [Clavibacter phaseoli]UKF36711.1 hypothetical protein FGI33_06275 [Clavibacter phaseoli]